MLQNISFSNNLSKNPVKMCNTKIFVQYIDSYKKSFLSSKSAF